MLSPCKDASFFLAEEDEGINEEMSLIMSKCIFFSSNSPPPWLMNEQKKPFPLMNSAAWFFATWKVWIIGFDLHRTYTEAFHLLNRRLFGRLSMNNWKIYTLQPRRRRRFDIDKVRKKFGSTYIIEMYAWHFWLKTFPLTFSMTNLLFPLNDIAGNEKLIVSVETHSKFASGVVKVLYSIWSLWLEKNSLQKQIA